MIPFAPFHAWRRHILGTRPSVAHTFMSIIRLEEHAVGKVLNPHQEIPDTGMDRLASGLGQRWLLGRRTRI
jgi:hypothetical protein